MARLDDVTAAADEEQGYLDLDDGIAIDLDLGLCLAGGSVLLTAGTVTYGVKLTKMVMELIESREGQYGDIRLTDLAVLDQVRHELALATGLLATRIKQERARTAQGLDEGGGGD